MDLASAEAYMLEALVEAEKAYDIGEMPVGAVIVMDGTVISRAHNLCETQNDPTAHAELIAIARAAREVGTWRLSGGILFSTLEPCPMCAGAVVNARIAQVFFGAYDMQYGCCGSVYRITEDPAFHHFAPSVGGIHKSECETLIHNHFRRCRRNGGKE